MSEKEVSAKIKKLIGEGKSQEQAVAIALEMQRRGKLDATHGMTKESVMKRKKMKQEKRMAVVNKKVGY